MEALKAAHPDLAEEAFSAISTAAGSQTYMGEINTAIAPRVCGKYDPLLNLAFATYSAAASRAP
jgi:hypothetical protein